MLTQYSIKMPHAVYGGENAMDNVTEILKKNGVKKVAMFTDKGIEGCGLFALPEEAVKASGAEYYVLDELPPEPSYMAVQKLVDEFKASGADMIVACGGGSVMDAAKLASVLVTDAYGVKELLDTFVKIAPAPRPIMAQEREVKPEEEQFTGFVFKIHANMDPNHRSCIAFVKVCSGVFKRNFNYKHMRSGKLMKFSAPTAFMAQKKDVVDEAYPGDIVGIPDTGNFKIGDTLTEGEDLHYKGLPSFSPEMFKYIENEDPMKTKQLNKGVEQLMDEGVAQLFVNQFNGRKIIGTVGQLQFEVIQYRLLHEYGAQCRWEPIRLYKAC